MIPKRAEDDYDGQVEHALKLFHTPATLLQCLVLTRLLL